MINPFKTNDKKYFSKIVQTTDTATFDAGTVHPVYATFALGRDAEWASRLFVLDMKEADEEGIGTYLHINHESPALIAEEVIFEATLLAVEGNAVHCEIIAKCDSRVIATIKTGQKIVKKEKLTQLFARLQELK